MVKSVLQFLLVLSALVATQLGQADNHASMLSMAASKFMHATLQKEKTWMT